MKLTEVRTLATPAGEPVFEPDSVKPREGTVLQTGESLHVELETRSATPAGPG